MSAGGQTDPNTLGDCQIGLGGLFATTTLCAAVAASYGGGILGLFAAIDLLVLGATIARGFSADRVLGIPLPRWDWFEMSLALIAIVGIQVITLLHSPVSRSGRDQAAIQSAVSIVRAVTISKKPRVQN